MNFDLSSSPAVERLLEHVRVRVVVHGETRVARPDVFEAWVEAAQVLEVFAQAFDVVFRHRRRELFRLQGLRHELRDEAARILHVFARANRLAAEHRVVLYPGQPVVIDERRELDVELLAVVEQRLVMPGNARRAAVEVEVRVLVELADLRITGFVDAIAVAHASNCVRRRETRLRAPGLRSPLRDSS